MGHGDDGGFWRCWSSHCVTAALFSVIFFFGLHLFVPEFLLRALDRAGSDAVIRGYRPNLTPMDPRIVVIDLGPGPTAEIVAGTLKSVARAHPKAVGLDLIVVPDLQDAPSKSGANPVDVLADALKDSNWQRPRIAMPVRDNEQFKDAIRTVEEIRPASVDLRHDEDGVVRSLCREQSASTELPTLAEAMLGLTEARCDPAHDRAILFAPVSSMPQAGDKSGLYIVTRETVASRPEILDDSYVLLGTTGRAAGSDRFLTPVGELPGVMIHAQSVWTLAPRAGPNPWIRWERYRKPLAWGLDLLTAFVAGAILSVYVALRGRPERYIGSIPQAMCHFAEALILLVSVAVVLLVLGVLWTWFAVRLLSAGVVIGAMSALFGAMLETLVHAGELLIHPLHWVVVRLMKHKTLMAATLTIFCIPLSGHAADCSYTVTVNPPHSKDWSVESGDAGPRHRKEQHDRNGRLQPFDRIVVKRGTSVTAQLADAPSALEMTVEGIDTDGGAALILPPCAPHTGYRGAWDNFWAAMNPRESTRSSGATLIWRGLETGEAARQGGPLRDLTTLVPAEGTVVGTNGLAFAWAGGNAPYHIAVEDEASGTPLARTQVAVAELWLSEWRTPPAPFVVIVTDAQGVAFWRHLRPLTPPPIGGDELGDAVVMYETAPEYRLEALRRLFIRSKAGDALAGRAIALIRIAGAGP